ncbi:RuvB-like protein 1 [Nematocida minor]|uniref:RuvB-like protein 1 n=1 Tax=Nematocida minor TaxID=1912983 RepID=UPI00221F7113|nr:RuvB-like protein 1 [Nematocida minor]KAI5193276.1 RuvB-like protein 1 [Nematocida minor]
MDKGLAHSHVTGLGVDRSMNITDEAGLFSMEKARKAASLFTDVINSKKTAGKALLITGESGSGKTALAVGISKELGPRVPFVRMTGSEVYSAAVRKTEILQQAIRRATIIRIREIKHVYEGEVVDIKIEEKEDPLNNYRKTVSNIFVSLRSAKRTERLTLNPSLSQEIIKQKITVGDVIYIEPEENIIKKMGRSDSYSSEFDIESDKYVSLPKGDIFTKKEVLQEMTLHEIDVANTKHKGKDVFSVMSQLQETGRVEITSKIRDEVDSKINKQLSIGAAEITPGVLFIDESHTMDTDCYSFLSTMLELSTCPVIILATNKSSVKVPETGEVRRFGIPEVFLSRMFVVRTEKPTKEVVQKIIDQKIVSEKIDITEDGRALLYKIANESTLRFAFSLLPLAALLSDVISSSAIKEVSQMFSKPKMK